MRSKADETLVIVETLICPLYMKHVLIRNNCVRRTTKIFLLSQQNRIIQFGFAEKYTRLVVQAIKDKIYAAH